MAGVKTEEYKTIKIERIRRRCVLSDKREEPARSGESCRLYEKKFYFKGLLASLQLLIYLQIVTGV